MTGVDYVFFMSKYETKYQSYPVLFFDLQGGYFVCWYVPMCTILVDMPQPGCNKDNYVFFGFDVSFNEIKKFKI